MKPLHITLLLTLLIPLPSYALKAEKVFSGLTLPWGFEFIDDHRLILNEKYGDISLVDLSNQTKTQLFHVPQLFSDGQGGLMDVKASPFEYDTFYFTYSQRVGGSGQTALARARIEDDKFHGWKTLLVTESGSDTSRHFGSRLTFDKQSIYMTVGERGIRDNAQNLSTHAGSVLRLTPQGQAFADNPFLTQSDAQPEIWSYGHRNPQGIVYDSATSRLWEIEHGPRGGDEINLVKKGANYGWPHTSHGKEYWGPVSVGDGKDKEGIESPKHVFTPSIAPGSMVLYKGDKYPELTGKLLVGALKLTHINVLSIEADQSVVERMRLFEDLNERVRQIAVNPQGMIFFSTDNGNLYRIIE
ncbi:PQQ-dependent sugar dehydrogenase [Vibrio sp. AK197]